MWLDYDPGDRHLRLRHRNDIRRRLADPGTDCVLRRGLVFCVAMVGWSFVCMGESTASTHHRQYRVDQSDTGGDGCTMECLAEPFHLTPTSADPTGGHPDGPGRFDQFIHKRWRSVYLRMLIDATNVTTCATLHPAPFPDFPGTPLFL